jgi:hypothetical protein
MRTAAHWRDYARTEIEKAAHLPTRSDPWSPSQPAKPTLERAYALVEAIRKDDMPPPLASTGPDGVFCLEWRLPDRQLAFFIYDDGLIEYHFATPTKPGNEGEFRDPIDQANEIVKLFLR